MPSYIHFSFPAEATEAEKNKFDQLFEITMGQGPIPYAEGRRIVADAGSKVGELYADANGDKKIDHFVFKDIMYISSGEGKDRFVHRGFEFDIFAGKDADKFIEDQPYGSYGPMICKAPRSQLLHHDIVKVVYGDIDNDGDADVALRLSNGAIKVYHRKE